MFFIKEEVFCFVSTVYNYKWYLCNTKICSQNYCTNIFLAQLPQKVANYCELLQKNHLMKKCIVISIIIINMSIHRQFPQQYINKYINRIESNYSINLWTLNTESYLSIFQKPFPLLTLIFHNDNYWKMRALNWYQEELQLSIRE